MQLARPPSSVMTSLRTSVGRFLREGFPFLFKFALALVAGVKPALLKCAPTQVNIIYEHLRLDAAHYPDDLEGARQGLRTEARAEIALSAMAAMATIWPPPSKPAPPIQSPSQLPPPKSPPHVHLVPGGAFFEGIVEDAKGIELAEDHLVKLREEEAIALAEHRRKVAEREAALRAEESDDEIVFSDEEDD